jgi:hypothetical protein
MAGGDSFDADPGRLAALRAEMEGIAKRLPALRSDFLQGRYFYEDYTGSGSEEVSENLKPRWKETTDYVDSVLEALAEAVTAVVGAQTGTIDAIQRPERKALDDIDSLASLQDSENDLGTGDGRR